MPSESIQYFQTSEALRAGGRDHLGVTVTALGNTCHSQCVLYSSYFRARENSPKPSAWAPKGKPVVERNEGKDWEN